MLGLVLVFFVLQLLGMTKEHDSAEADHDVDHDVDADADADADHDADGDGDQPGGVLSFFGMGRIPFMVIWLTLFIFSGFSGLVLNRVVYVRNEGWYPTWFFGIALVSSLVVGLAGVFFFGRLAGKLVDTGGKGSTRKEELQGKAGIVASVTVDEKGGEIRVTDAAGNEMLVHGRIQAGEKVPRRGEKVVLVDYDAEKDLFWVSSSPDL
jgi:hypothetical protein